MVFIKDLQPRQTGVDVTGEIVEMGSTKEFSKFGKNGKVATAFLKDQTAKVKLSLWNEQIDQVKVHDTIKITNGYVNEFQGELQLTTGKFGTIEVLDSKADALTQDNIEEASILNEISKPHDQDEFSDDDLLDDPSPKKRDGDTLDVEEERID
jgi:replication factor A1